jgi:hypothetical protein
MMATAENKQPAATVDETTVQVALSLFEHIEDQINHTDTKAQVVLAADAIILGWLSTQKPNVVQAVFGSHAAAGGRFLSVLVVLVFVGLFLSLACGLVVIWPRARATTGATLVYFGAIARRREPEFVTAFMQQSQGEVTQTVLAGVHATARIAQQKFRWVSGSVAFLLGALVLWTVLEVIRLVLV